MRTILLLLLLAFVMGNCEAQGVGVLTLTTSDQTGAIIPGAEVLVESTIDGMQHRAKTSVIGEASLSLKPGMYRVSVTAVGFSVLQESIQVQGSDNQRLGLKLQVLQYYWGPCCFEPPNLPLTASEPLTVMIPETPPQNEQGAARDTQVRGYWLDPSTGLMWAAKDSGKDLSCSNAVSYCRDLRSGGHSDWRLATMFELQGIYDSTANALGLTGMHSEKPTTWHVKGNLSLSAYEWSSQGDGVKHCNSHAYYFDFNEGKSNDQLTGWAYPYDFRRALCVRGNGGQLGGQQKP